MKNPWLKFYPSDLVSEKTLKMCSWESRWLWVEMLRVMHEATPYGYLVIHKQPVTDAQLAMLTGTDESTVFRLRTELEKNRVYSRNSAGVVYSRRMTRDYQRAKKGEKAAKKRWEKHIDNKGEIGPPNGSGNGLPFTQILEARNQKLESKEYKKKKLRTLADLEASDLNGPLEAFFKEKAPNVDRFKLRQDMVLWCKSKGKTYKDYGAALMQWGLKKQKEIGPVKKNNMQLQLEAMQWPPE